jgi:hypothetical protein
VADVVVPEAAAVVVAVVVVATVVVAVVALAVISEKTGNGSSNATVDVVVTVTGLTTEKL